MVHNYPTTPRALVYSGAGAGSRSVNSAVDALRKSLNPSKVRSVETIDAESVLTSNWESDCIVFVMPGGADLPYCRDLGKTIQCEDGTVSGIKKIKRWVEEDGGFYLGLCAGAYFASGMVEFERGNGAMEVVGERELKFYKGTAKGAVFPGFCYETEAGAVAAHVRYVDPESSLDACGRIRDDIPVQWKSCRDYVNGGPYWLCQNNTETLRINSVDTGADVEILATYPEKNHAAAAIRCPVGKGLAVLCSSHPELDSETYLHGAVEMISDHVERLKQDIGHPDLSHNQAYLQHVQKLVQTLDCNANKRKDLFRLLLSAGGLKTYLR
jgi:biotin--protein ligase